jgi:hypothetical protein
MKFVYRHQRTLKRLPPTSRGGDKKGIGRSLDRLVSRSGSGVIFLAVCRSSSADTG